MNQFKCSMQKKINESVMSPSAALRGLEPTDAGAIYRILKEYNSKAAQDYMDGLEMLKEEALSNGISENMDEMSRPRGTKFQDMEDIYLHPLGTNEFIRAKHAATINGLDYFVCEKVVASITFDADSPVTIELCDKNQVPQGNYRYNLVDSNRFPEFMDVPKSKVRPMEIIGGSFMPSNPYYIACKAFKYETPMDGIEINGKVYPTINLGGLQWMAKPLDGSFGEHEIWGNPPTCVYDYEYIQSNIVHVLKRAGLRLPTQDDLRRFMKDPKAKNAFVGSISARLGYVTPIAAQTTNGNVDTVEFVSDGTLHKGMLHTWGASSHFAVLACKDI